MRLSNYSGHQQRGMPPKYNSIQRGSVAEYLAMREPPYHLCQRPVVSRLSRCRPDGQTLTATLLLLCLAVSDDYCLPVAALPVPESSTGRNGECSLSVCWDHFYLDAVPYIDDIDASPDSSRCFETVLSRSGEPGLDLEEHQQLPALHDEVPVSDESAPFRNLYPRERSQLKSSNGQPGVHFKEGPEDRRRRYIDGVGDHRRKLCAALRTLADCIDAADQQCRGILSYHSSQRLARSTMKRCRCSNNSSSDNQLQLLGAMNSGRRDHSVVRPGSDNTTMCRYVESTEVPQSSLCVVYGDPHIRAFDGHFQTCHVLGTWPLIDNEYLTVQITNSHMGWGNGTAVSKVAVIVKHHGDCTAPHGQHLTYFADEGRLPSTWNDDVVNIAATPLKGVEIFEAVPAERVEIYVLHAATVVSVRLVGRYYSVSVLLPVTLLNRPGTGRRNAGSGLAANQLCRTGCPTTEVVDLDAFFRQTVDRQVKTKRTTGDLKGRRAVLPLPVALQTCGEAVGLSGYLTDSCIFDLLNTGDLSFARLSAVAALADVRALLGGAGLTVAFNNDNVGATVAERLKAETEVTSSAGLSLPSTATCRWLIFSPFFFAVVSALLAVHFTDTAFSTSLL